MTKAAGLLRDRVSVERTTPTTSNAAGERVDAWAVIANRWAHVVPTRGAEVVRGRQRRAEVTHVIVFRFDPDTAAFKPKDRVNIGGRLLNFSRVFDPTGRRQEIEAEAIEVVT